MNGLSGHSQIFAACDAIAPCPEPRHGTRCHFHVFGPDARKHSVILRPKISKSDVFPESLTGADLNPADLQKPVDLSPGKAMRRFVSRDAVFIQAPRLRAALKDHNIVASHRQAMRGGAGMGWGFSIATAVA